MRRVEHAVRLLSCRTAAAAEDEQLLLGSQQVLAVHSDAVVVAAAVVGQAGLGLLGVGAAVRVVRQLGVA